jgi:hypothetical protein
LVTESRPAGPLPSRAGVERMEIQEALAVIRKLAGGMHPETGEILHTDCLYRHPQAVRAMLRAVSALEFQNEREHAKRFLPSNAGKSWSTQEDAGTSSARLRGRAIQQKLQMRAARAVSQAAASGGAWVSLGPSPFPSDASGIGLQGLRGLALERHGLRWNRRRCLRQQHGDPQLDRSWAECGTTRISTERGGHVAQDFQLRRNEAPSRGNLRARNLGMESGSNPGFSAERTGQFAASACGANSHAQRNGLWP